MEVNYKAATTSLAFRVETKVTKNMNLKSSPSHHNTS